MGKTKLSKGKMRRISELHANNYSMSDIARVLHVSSASVHDVISDINKTAETG